MAINLSKFKSKLIRIDSSKGTEYLNNYKSSFSYAFDPISTDANESIIYSLINISIPYSYYSTNKHNQYLDVAETINNVTIIRNLIIPAGNYSALTYKDELLSLLNTTTKTYDIKYNKVQNRYTIAIITPNTVSILLFDTGANNKESCYKFLGFNKVDVNISHNPLLSTNCVTMSDILFAVNN